MAKLLHNLPSGLLLGGLGLLGGLQGWPACAACIRSVAGHGVWTVLQWSLTLLLPAAAGALRVALLGQLPRCSTHPCAKPAMFGRSEQCSSQCLWLADHEAWHEADCVRVKGAAACAAEPRQAKLLCKHQQRRNSAGGSAACVYPRAGNTTNMLLPP